MSVVDWVVLAVTLLTIVGYGVYKSRATESMHGYLLGNQSLPWYTVCLSVMATQASAITFLSAPGLAYSTGMGFVQFYFGLPLAMIVLSITFIPIFHRLKVYTAYEFLETRFDLKTRALTAFLFLVQRGLSTGFAIYAPAIILSVILDIDTVYTTLFIGGLVIFYTVYGGTKAVSYTQMLQMGIIFSGLFIAGVMIVKLLPPDVGFGKALHIAGKMGRTRVLDFHFSKDNFYSVWSGLIGGFFLQLSYFGTDQSQVGRYLTGASIGQSRIGLLMNGLLKIPMQFLILLIGVLLFSFYQYHQPPVFFNKYELGKLEKSTHRQELQELKTAYSAVFNDRTKRVGELTAALDRGDQQQVNRSRNELKAADDSAKAIREQVGVLMKKYDADANTNDNNYIFLSFVTGYFPRGLVGLLVAIIFLASMGSTSSALNSLASTSVVDIYKRLVKKDGPDGHYILASRVSTVIWGVFCVIMALYASRLGNLIEAVNILGSLFYGTILGIFVVAFYFKKLDGTAVFIAAVISEVVIYVIHRMEIIAYLWYNLLGCALVIGIAYTVQYLFIAKEKPATGNERK
ncbi:sodium:solute symporter [Hufsiella ginkgonis]|uniref:Sodium:solute symporter n=1 Tax=Hufsiella ginkgonis TaxID=2695274 RepID=A0A7K1XTL7_9SPHI|nr:sodium:solute symporter [Hufsiella ginkgonis]MXV14361.1 sodium:solute symporter [Hufsiella ginkgonis]